MNSEFKDKLINYEERPPQGIWPAIEAALDDNSVPSSLSERLFQFEEKPSEKIWTEIEKTIGPQQEAELKNLPVRYHKILRFSVAAAVLVAVAIGIRFFTMGKPTDEVAYTVKVSTPQKTPAPAIPDTFQNEQPEKNIKKESKVEVSKTEAPGGSSEISAEERKPVQNISPRYLTVADEKGKVVRLSKKVLPVFDCAGKTASAINRCKENIQLLQQKMASSLVSPSGDFAGLMDMIKTLEEKQ